jgi:hypothetical protein
MSVVDSSDDEVEICALIERQFASLSWTPQSPADWDGFAADFLPDAKLWPATRPAAPRSVDTFVDRMKGLADSSLPSLQEKLAGLEIIVRGNVAVAAAICEMVENGGSPNRNVEMLLLVKSGGAWRSPRRPGTPPLAKPQFTSSFSPSLSMTPFHCAIWAFTKLLNCSGVP